MLKKIQIKNFQGHEDSTLDLSLGINIIAGENDQGKTAVIRALRWVILNRPLGTSFIRHGAKWAEVSLTLDVDGKEFIITRRRSSSENSYSITTPDGEVTKFENFGSDPPEMVQSLLKLENLNIQTQFEPYLITQPSGQITALIREHTDLDALDQALTKTKSHCHSLKSQIDQCQEQKKAIESLLQQINTIDLDQLHALLQQSEKIEEKKHQLQRKIESLTAILEEHQKISKRLSVLPSNISNLISDVENKLHAKEELSFLYNQLQKTVDQVQLIQKVLEDFPEIPDTDSIQTLIDSIENQRARGYNLQSLIKGVREVRTSLDQIVEKILKLEGEINTLKQTASSESCPTCGRPLSGEVVDEILKDHGI